MDAIQRSRAKHERFIAILVVVIASLGSMLSMWRFAELGGPRPTGLVGIQLLMASYYAWVFFTTRDIPPPRATAWMRSTIEVTAAFVVMIAEWRTLGAEVALSSGANFVVILTLIVSALRLDPPLLIYAAALVFAQQAFFFVVIRPDAFGTFVGRPQPQLFRMVVTLMAALLGYVLARTLTRETAAAAERARIRAAFGSYVDPRVVDAVLRGKLTVEPQRKVVTVVFVDIRGFTALSETTDPARVFRMLSDALDAFAIEVQKQGGIVNKFLGDGLMALFGAPETQPDHARRAVRAGLQIASVSARMAEDGRFPGLRVGIGIHTGEAVVGDLGGARREFTAIGDVVNVAARIEQANKDFHTTLLITDAVRGSIGEGAELRMQPALTVRGRMEKVEVFEVRGLRGTGLYDKDTANPVGTLRTPPSSPA